MAGAIGTDSNINIGDVIDDSNKYWPLTSRDDVFLGIALGAVSPDAIEKLIPPVITNTREWLLLALAKKLNEIEAVANEIGAVEAPEKLASTDSLETAIETINSIINCLIDAGVFVDVKNASPEQPGMIDPEQ